MIIAILNTIKFQFSMIKEIKNFDELLNVVIATPIVYATEKYKRKIKESEKQWK